MKIIFILFILLPVIISPAQEIFFGAGYATGQHSFTGIETDSFAIETSNNTGRKFIMPTVLVSWNLNNRLYLGARMNYRRHTISLRGWDNRADTCLLCPVIKGGGPTIHEIRFAGEISLAVQYWRFGSLWLVGGAGVSVPVHTDNNQTDINSPLQQIFTAAGSLATASPIFELGLAMEIGRFQFRAIKCYSPSYTQTFNIEKQEIPFKTNESMWSFSFMFSIYRQGSP